MKEKKKAVYQPTNHQTIRFVCKEFGALGIFRDFVQIEQVAQQIIS
jgi:hypothetical protein